MFDPDLVVFDVSDIWKAREGLRGSILRTPLLHSPAISQRVGCEIHLKMECWQVAGCFKVRGAMNLVSTLDEADKARGLVTCSSGNHGTALAYAASVNGQARTRVFLPSDADPNKVRKLQLFGAEAVLHGSNFIEALHEALRYAKQTDAIYAHSHSYPLIIAGQGTIGLEIVEDLPDVDMVLVPVGGGGLISGIATAVKSALPDAEIIGVEAAAAPGAYLSFQDGFCHETVDIRPSLADGLLGSLTPLTWRIARVLVSEVVLVEEEEIAEAMRVFQEDEQLMVEGSAAVGLAAILSGKVLVANKKVGLVLTGRNIDATKYNGVMRG